MNVTNISGIVSKGVTILNETKNSNIVYDNIDKILLGYQNTISLMWILLIVVLSIILIGFSIWYFGFYRYKYKIYIKLPSGELEKYRFISVTDKVRIEHSKKDIFFYMIDTDCMILEGKYKTFLFFYRNPNPIRLDSEKHKVTTEIQNIDRVLDSDVIQKFVLAGDIFNTLKMLLIIILVMCLILGFGEYLIYNKEVVCSIGGLNG
jgi:hypothetical protein